MRLARPGLRTEDKTPILKRRFQEEAMVLRSRGAMVVLQMVAWGGCLWGTLNGTARGDERERLKLEIKDLHVEGNEWWFYNDMQQAFRLAKKENKPIFVTFRCVPCKNCKGFDAEVAKGRGGIAQLAREKFIPVRQVEMKGVDLSQFQFDYDLNWAAMFVNADGTVYARYGTQSAEGPDAYNSLYGLEETMKRVLEMHAAYPGNRGELEGKRGAAKEHGTALEMPGLERRASLSELTKADNCIHCHMIHDAEHREAWQKGNFQAEMLYKYPLPENLGLKMNNIKGWKIDSVVSGSAAAKAGLKKGEEITHVNGQAIASIADIQWVLHHLPNERGEVRIKTGEGKEVTVSLEPGWKKMDISWRGSMWGAPPRLHIWFQSLNEERIAKLGLKKEAGAFDVRWINLDEESGRAARDAGLKEGDVIVKMGDKEIPAGVSEVKVITELKFRYKTGEKLPIQVLRDGKRIDLEWELRD